MSEQIFNLCLAWAAGFATCYLFLTYGAPL